MKRHGISKIKYLLMAGAGVVLIVCSIFLFAPSRSAKRVELNIDALKEILERSAAEIFPLPSVSDGRIELQIKPGHFDSEVERVLGIATDLGGTALQSGEDEVLAQVPTENVLEFQARVTGRELRKSDAKEKAGEVTQLIVVHLAGGASKKPSSKPEASP